MSAEPTTPAHDWRADRVRSALAGTIPTVLAHLGAAFAVIGDVQFLPGYCVALTDTPGADRLTDLPRARRHRFLADVEILAEAVERVCTERDRGFRRVNIEILGNRDPFLHAHVWPRFDWEPPELLQRPVWAYPSRRWADPETALGDGHAELRRSLTDELLRLRASEPAIAGADS